MSNEELVAEIQNGRECLLNELWVNIEKFVRLKANKFYNKFTDPWFEVDDLYNTAYIYFVGAVRSYVPEAGKKFIGYFANYYLPTAFSECAGIRTTKKYHDPLNGSISLDTPLSNEEDITLLDTIADSENVISDVDDRLTSNELKCLLDEMLHTLPEQQESILCSYYYDSKSITDIAALHNISINKARSLKSKGLAELRKPSISLNKLTEFIDCNTPFYLRVACRSQTSPVELIAEKREKIRISMREKYTISV